MDLGAESTSPPSLTPWRPQRGGPAAAINATIASFPTPAEFATALTGALAGFIPGIGVAAQAAAKVIGDLSAAVAGGIALSSTAVQAVLTDLVNGGAGVAAALQASLGNIAPTLVHVGTVLAQAAANAGVEFSAALQATLWASRDRLMSSPPRRLRSRCWRTPAVTWPTSASPR